AECPEWNCQSCPAGGGPHRARDHHPQNETHESLYGSPRPDRSIGNGSTQVVHQEVRFGMGRVDSVERRGDYKDRCARVRIRRSASSNIAGSGRRLRTRHASRGKSKKYPGWIRTSSSARRERTSSSSGTTAGICKTAYQPPSLSRTRHDEEPAPVRSFTTCRFATILRVMAERIPAPISK